MGSRENKQSKNQRAKENEFQGKHTKQRENKEKFD